MTNLPPGIKGLLHIYSYSAPESPSSATIGRHRRHLASSGFGADHHQRLKPSQPIQPVLSRLAALYPPPLHASGIRTQLVRSIRTMKISSILFILVLSLAFLDYLPVKCQDTATIAEEVGIAEADTVQESFPVNTEEVVIPDASDLGVAAQQAEEQTEQQPEQIPREQVQTGPLIDLLGTKLYSLKIVDEQSAEIREHYTNEALAGKKVIGLYFSADW